MIGSAMKKILLFMMLPALCLAKPGDPTKFTGKEVPKGLTLMERVESWDHDSKFVDFDDDRRIEGALPLTYQNVVFTCSDKFNTVKSCRTVFDFLHAEGKKKQIIFVIGHMTKLRSVSPEARGKDEEHLIVVRMAAYPAHQATD